MTIIEIIGWTIIVFFLAHIPFLFIADHLSKKLAKKYEVKGIFLKRIKWMYTHLNSLPENDKRMAKRALFAYYASIACFLIILIVGLIVPKFLS
jgi:hypothetical protein